MNNFFTFKGRINRAKYFLTCFISAIIFTTFYSIALGSENTFITILGVLTYIGYIVFVATLIVRRLHDLERPGIHYWLCLIPIYNIYLGLLLVFKKGTDGSNEYGEDPLGIKEIA